MSSNGHTAPRQLKQRVSKGNPNLTQENNKEAQTLPVATSLSQVEPELEKTRVWHHPDNGKVFEDSFIIDWITSSKKDEDNEYKLIVGTDSHLHKLHYKFITVVCLYRVGKGGMFYRAISHAPREQFRGNQKGRMYYEAGISIETANWLVETTGYGPEIHLDVSPKHKGNFTSAFSDQLKGYVVSSGFEAVIKGSAWAASSIADHFSK